jgi:hypothetical protein
LGEIICDKCNGTGLYNDGTYILRCPKCKGKKKLDWCEQIVGVAPEKIDDSSFSTFSQTIYNKNYNIPPFQQYVIDKLAESMAAKIDKEIMDCLIGNWEHNINDKKGE